MTDAKAVVRQPEEGDGPNPQRGIGHLLVGRADNILSPQRNVH